MKLKLFRNSDLSEDRVEIHYKNKSREVDKLINYIRESSKKTIIGILNGTEIVLSQEHLFYFESVDKKCYGYSEGEVYRIKSTLSSLEDVLNRGTFARVNKSMILNIYKVESIKSDLNMRTIAMLYNGEKVVISRRYQKEFRAKLYSLRDRLQEKTNEIDK